MKVLEPMLMHLKPYVEVWGVVYMHCLNFQESWPQRNILNALAHMPSCCCWTAGMCKVGTLRPWESNPFFSIKQLASQTL